MTISMMCGTVMERLKATSIQRAALACAAAIALSGAGVGCIGEPPPESPDDAEETTAEAEEALTYCSPGPNEVAVFYDSAFSSSCTYLGVGLYPTAASTGLPNDSISSILVGSNVKATLFRDSQFSGVYQTLNYSVAYLSTVAIGNDTVSSMRVEPLNTDCQNPPPGSVALFKDKGYSGDCVIRHASETFCGAGAGTFTSSACIGLANDSISSIKVGYGTWVYLCRDTQLGGYCSWENSHQYDLACLAIGTDKVSSLYVSY